MALPTITRCLAPNFDVSPQTAALFGLIADTTVAVFYLRDRGKSFFFPVNDQDFADSSTCPTDREPRGAPIAASCSMTE